MLVNRNDKFDRGIEEKEQYDRSALAGDHMYCVWVGMVLAAVGSASAAADALILSATHPWVSAKSVDEDVVSPSCDLLPPLLASTLLAFVPASAVQPTMSMLSPTIVMAEDGSPARIAAPSVKLEALVVPVGWKYITQDGKVARVWEVADCTAGWYKSSAVPEECTVDRHLPWFAADIGNLWPHYINTHRVIVIARPDY
jgi:hypothetical protein